VNPLVSIGLPLYKRLEYLSHVLRIIEAQDYPEIDLIVSDNGVNGAKIRRLVDANYSRPYRFRQNPATVVLSAHLNQLINFATGEYYMMLADDDEITPNYVSEAVRRLQQTPTASLALARQESIDKDGVVLGQTVGGIPPVLSGPDLLRGTWKEYAFCFQCFSTFIAKTAELKACGGYPDFIKGYAIDNAVVVKLSLKGDVVFSPSSTFRWRVDGDSFGWSAPIADLAGACRQYMRWLETDPTLVRYGEINPVIWSELKDALQRNEWRCYRMRWSDIYRHRLSGPQWLKAAFAMPYSYSYYREVASVLYRSLHKRLQRLVGSADLAEEELMPRPFRTQDAGGRPSTPSGGERVSQRPGGSQR
jgi:glycosyltransferase involved in cell wall biosynthesis